MGYLVTMNFQLRVPDEIDSLGDCQWYLYKKLKHIMENPECDVLDDFDRLLSAQEIGWDISIMEPVNETH